MVIQRLPAPDVPGRPRCYGFHHDPAMPRCKGCAFAGNCKLSTQIWASRRSIRQQAGELERSFMQPPDAAEYLEIYSELHRVYFGRPLPNGRDLPVMRALMSVVSWCRDNDADPVVYITAQMAAMQKSVRVRQYGFSLNMLTSGRAPERYYAFVDAAWRRTKEVSARSMAHDTPLAKIQRGIADTEYQVALWYVRDVVSGGSPVWNDIVSMFDVDQFWLGLRLNDRDVVAHLEGQFGKRVAGLMLPLATMQAACSIASSYGTMLPDRISFAPIFTWESFAVLMRRLYAPRAPLSRVDIRASLGTAWIPGATLHEPRGHHDDSDD